MVVCPSCGEENPARFRLCGFCGAPLAEPVPVQEVRKTVTIVFSDLKGSTSLGERIDSEALREVMSRYFEEMRGALEEHGGLIEKYIGDAIMAVFGLPRIREDDALRAVRAADEMKRRLAVLNEELEQRWGVALQNRTGVNTGEIVAGDPTSGQRLVIGDTVNVAARLEQAAGAQEVLIGEPTYRLVRDSVVVEPVEPLELKGKAERVPAYRLVSVEQLGMAHRRQLPLVGRDAELEALESAFEAAVSSSSCRLVTVVAQAGVGKSRLIEEFFGRMGDRATALSGRCLPYGRGITFWPLIEAVRQAAGIDDDDSPDAATAKIAALTDDHDVRARIASAIGLGGEEFPIPELFWGARKLAETLAARKPLILHFDDIHWAETTFLELVDYVRTTSEGVPIVLVCATRPDLLEKGEWPSTPEDVTIRLSPLDDAGANQVIDHVLGSDAVPGSVRARIVEAAEGNPLFVEQLLSMLIEEGVLVDDDGGWRVTRDLSDGLTLPGSIEALLTARLDLLTDAERAVIEPASVIGQTFVRPALETLVADAVRPRLDEHLGTLVTKQLVRPDPTTSPDAFRFEHILIRDAAYNRLLKRARADLHERFVEWAEQVNRDRNRETEYEEILGYHLEQAYRYLGQLGPLDDHGVGVGVRAAAKLAATGRRAFERGDMAAAANLLERATALRPALDPARLALFPELGEALMQIGAFEHAASLLEDAVATAEVAGEPTLAANAELVRMLVLLLSGAGEQWEEQAHEAARDAIERCQEAGDDAGLARAWRLLGWIAGRAWRLGETADALQRAIECARRAGDVRQERRASTQYALTLVYGPTPIAEGLARCDEIVGRVQGDRQAEAAMLCVRAQLEAMRGEFEVARDLYGRARAMFEELGLRVDASTLCLSSSHVELLAGDPQAAERELRRGLEHLTALGERYLLPSLTGLLAETLVTSRRLDEAEEAALTTEELADEDDVDAQSLWRSARAKVHAARGSLVEAEALAREAVDLLAPTDGIVNRVSALTDLAGILLLAGREEEARSIGAEARALAERKGSSVMVERLDSLTADAALARPAS
ncbi:MAG TPA: adenylate/guanylate cyclase domain-containing protein [Gaiellaceae bacterium]|nr:adenylate/guanylate cyclase domain-containing protein [Gaiellaceae bacterium]